MAFENKNTGYRRFTEAEIAAARQTELVAVAGALGYHPKRIGKYYELEEHDSLRIFPDNTYCRFANVIDGKPETGSAIDFAMRYGGMEFREAVSWLLNYSGRSYVTENNQTEHNAKNQTAVQSGAHSNDQMNTEKQTESPEFCLPEPNDNNRRMYAYLCKTRGIPSGIVHEMWKQGLIYESRQHHNVVFVSRDKDGEPRHAFMRGTAGTFKCDVPGSDKFHFCFVIPARGSRMDTVCVYEGAIDAISAKALDYLDWKIGEGEPWRIALGMLSDSSLEYFLSEHPEVNKIRFCMDLDKRGREAVLGKPDENGNPGQGGLLEKWKNAGYQVTDNPPELERGQGKDYNDLLMLRMKAQREQPANSEYGWKQARNSPFTEERDRMLQRVQPVERKKRYGQTLATDGERDKAKNRKKNRDRASGKSGELQRYRNRPDVSYSYGYKKQKLRR